MYFYGIILVVSGSIGTTLNDDDYSDTFINIVAVICGGVLCFSTVFALFLCCKYDDSDYTYEKYIYNRIKKIKRKQDRKYRKWLM